MNPVMLHADGTDCRHSGEPQATTSTESGPICPDGQPITHIRFNGKTLTIEEATEAFQAMTRAAAEAFAHLTEVYAGLSRAVGAAMAPVLRAVAKLADDSEPS